MNKLWWIDYDNYQNNSEFYFDITKEMFDMKKWAISISEKNLENLKLSFSKHFPYSFRLTHEEWVSTYFEEKYWLKIQFFDNYKWRWPALRFEFWNFEVTENLKKSLSLFDDKINDKMNPYKISKIILKKIVNFSQPLNKVNNWTPREYVKPTHSPLFNNWYGENILWYSQDISQPINEKNNWAPRKYVKPTHSPLLTHWYDENDDSWNSFESNVEKYKNNNFSVVWDVDWDYWNFEKMSIESWIMDINWNWINWNNKAIYLWDILADRSADWLKILEKIRNLKKQAKSQWWDVEVIAWNHDEFLFWYLSWKWVNIPNLEYYLKYNDEWIWLLTELKKYWQNLYNPSEILQNMKTSSEGLQDLENIINMKLCVVSWDTIFFHTPPNDIMFEIIFSQNWKTIEEKVENLNKNWKSALNWVLLNDWFGNTTAFYQKYAKAFLNTANDTEDWIILRGWEEALKKYSDQIAFENTYYYQQLKNSWINNLVYWHTDSLLSKKISWVNTYMMNRKSMKKVDWNKNDFRNRDSIPTPFPNDFLDYRE